MTDDKAKSRQIEEILVDELIERVSERLADRRADRHSPPWSPKQEVQIGVLRPRWTTPKTQRQVGAASEDVVEESDGDALAAADTLGFDFVISPTSNRTRISVDLSFVIYLPEYPSFDEARQLLKSDQTRSDSALEGQPRKTIPLQYAWRRKEIPISGVELELAPDGIPSVVFEPITQASRTATEAHYSRSEAARPFLSNYTIAVSALGDSDSFKEALAAGEDSAWNPSHPHIDLVAFVEPLPGGDWHVSVSLTNQTLVEERTPQDLAIYDAKLAVRIDDGTTLRRQRFRLAPEDYRYQDVAEVPGHGRGCAVLERNETLYSETLPVFRQNTMVPRSDHVPPLGWQELSEDTDFLILERVRVAMHEYAAEWQRWIDGSASDEARPQSAVGLEGFRQEIETFELGLTALRGDQRLATSFHLANEAFARANAGKQFFAWRLFQLVYIVSHLPALAARESGSTRYREELDKVDVLWFPTGGGKTEAYLGLILVAAFFDRLRGKSAGVTAWLKFPLRMLSVQQLIRVLRILTIAEHLRVEKLGGAGAPFELGYLVGSGNTPNRLQWPQRWWPGFAAAAKVVQDEPTAFDQHRLVGQCPYCLAKGDAIGLEVDSDSYTLRHICRKCDSQLPLHITDDEVFRYQPTVIVSTIDKVTGFAYFGEFTSFNRGPRKECSQHGYFAFGDCPVAQEKDKALKCSVNPSQYSDVDWRDPVPALTIQDELHLVREELGVFAAHFEGLIAELQIGGPSGLPTKILGATATIEQFHDQLRQVYGRHPRRFPSPGYLREKSFYIDTIPETRRVFMGVMPTGSGVSKVEAGARIQETMIKCVHAMQDDLPGTKALLTAGLGSPLSTEEVADLLFNYELSLGFVNSKNAGAQLSDSVSQLSSQFEAAGEDRIVKRVLTGEVDVPELAEAIDLVEDASLTHSRSNRLRALIGTSVVSHGVDLERLNLMTMVGLPSTTADYIQATSRSGRIHVGLVVTVYDHFQRREASSFSHFLSGHQLLDILVEPVPVNRYAQRAVDRTLPSIVAGLLWDLARDSQFNAPAQGIHLTRYLRPWWNAEAPQLVPHLEKRIEATYRSRVSGVNPSALENQSVAAALLRWNTTEKLQMTQWDGDKLIDLFRVGVMSSLRDVDTAVEFGAGASGQAIHQAMFPHRSA